MTDIRKSVLFDHCSLPGRLRRSSGTAGGVLAPAPPSSSSVAMSRDPPPPKIRIQTIRPLSCTIKILICHYRISDEIINYEREYLNYSPEAGNRFLFSALSNESRL